MRVQQSNPTLILNANTHDWKKKKIIKDENFQSGWRIFFLVRKRLKKRKEKGKIRGGEGGKEKQSFKISF